MNNGDVVVGREHAAQPQLTDEQLRIPAADVYETPDAFVLMLDLPGTTREGINLTLEKGEMRVKAVIRRQHAQGSSMLMNEMAEGGFYRAFTIGEGIDTANVDANFAQGVLTVKLFKSENLKPREIRIN